MISELLKKLTDIAAAPGRERRLGEAIKALAAPYADRASFDAMGSLIVFKSGCAPQEKRRKVMFAAHLDEIGFVANCADQNGFIHIAPLGGVEWKAAEFSHVVFENGVYGEIVPSGVPGASGGAAYVADIGASSREEAEKLVRTGDMATFEPRLRELAGGRLSGHPLDNRAGCAVLLEALMRTPGPRNDVCLAFTAQEEVGCRGAGPAAFGEAPDFAVAVDVTDAYDGPGSELPNAAPGEVRIGGGAAVKLKDEFAVCDIGLFERLNAIAVREGIAHQIDVLNDGGTDAGRIAMTGAGVRTGGISIPSRYVHTPSELIDPRDAEECVRLAAAVMNDDLENV
jgi:putative aminopeptidase FrvX